MLKVLNFAAQSRLSNLIQSFIDLQEPKKSKLLLGKNNSKEDEEEEDAKPQEQQKDKFNLSNDEYYTAKNSKYY